MIGTGATISLPASAPGDISRVRPTWVTAWEPEVRTGVLSWPARFASSWRLVTRVTPLAWGSLENWEDRSQGRELCLLFLEWPSIGKEGLPFPWGGGYGG